MTLKSALCKTLIASFVIIPGCLFSVSANASEPALTGGCGTNTTPEHSKAALQSMRINTPVYLTDRTGKFLKVDLRTQTRILISDHGFDHTPELLPSADGRWISYSGKMKGDRTQYWLYDKRTGTDRLVLEHPAWGGHIPEFSPDGRMIAIFANYDSRWPSNARAGFHVFDTETLQPSSIHIPTTISAKDGWASPQWSHDGSELLIMIRSMAAGPEKREYYSYRPSTKQIEKISGKYDSMIHDDVFTRYLRRISAFPPSKARSVAGMTSESSPNGKLKGYLGKENPDSSYPLNVVDKNGIIKKVVVGHYENCAGQTIAITGWIDDLHLVYRDRFSQFYVFDAATNRTAELFNEKEEPFIFTW